MEPNAYHIHPRIGRGWQSPYEFFCDKNSNLSYIQIAGTLD